MLNSEVEDLLINSRKVVPNKINLPKVCNLWKVVKYYFSPEMKPTKPASFFENHSQQNHAGNIDLS